MNEKNVDVSAWAWIALMGLALLPGCASRSSPPPQWVEPTVMVMGMERPTPMLANEGRPLPLRRAVEQLTPRDYSIRWLEVDPARQAATVTWRAGQTWTDALEEAVQAVPGLVVTIATGSRLVLVRAVSADLRPLPKKQEEAPRPPDKEAERLQGAGKLTPVKLEQVAVQVAKAAPPILWSLEFADQTLRGALERWCRKAGWRLFWEMDVDYPVTAPADIEGSFEDAVAVLVRSLSQADVPPKAVIYRGNHVLRFLPRGKE